MVLRLVNDAKLLLESRHECRVIVDQELDPAMHSIEKHDVVPYSGETRLVLHEGREKRAHEAHDPNFLACVALCQRFVDERPNVFAVVELRKAPDEFVVFRQSCQLGVPGSDVNQGSFLPFRWTAAQAFSRAQAGCRIWCPLLRRVGCHRP